MKGRRRRKKSGKELIPKDKAKFIPYVLFILALALRLYFTPAGLFHTDSVIATIKAERTVASGQLHYLQGPMGYPGFAVVNSLIYGAYKALTGAQSAENILIFSIAIVGSLSVVLVYIFGQQLMKSKTAGFYSALFMAFLPLHLSLSTYVKDQMLGLSSLLITAILALKAANEDTLKNKLALGAAFGFTMAVRQQDILFLPTLIMLYYLPNFPLSLKKSRGAYDLKLKAKPSKIITDLALIIGLAALVFTSFYVPKMLHGWNLIENFLESKGEQSGYSLFSRNLTEYSIPWVTDNITHMGWIILALGIYFSYKSSRYVCFILAYWMIIYLIIFGNFRGVSPYFFFHSFPPILLFMGWGLKTLFERYGHAVNALAALVCVLMLMNIMPVLEYRRTVCGPCEFSKKIGEVAPHDSAVIGMDETVHYEYYAKVSKVMGHPNPADEKALIEHFRKIDSLIENGTKVYITSPHGLSYDYMPQGILTYDPERQMLINRANMKAYANLIYDTADQALIDRQTKQRLPGGGLYSLELFNEYRVTPVFTMESEDWHHKELQTGKLQATLYKIEERV